MFRSKSTPRFDTRDLHPRVRREGESSRLVNQTLASEGMEGGEGERTRVDFGYPDLQLDFLANADRANCIEIRSADRLYFTRGSHKVGSRGRQTGTLPRPFLACSLWLSLQTICQATRERERQNREMMATLELGCNLSEERKPS